MGDTMKDPQPQYGTGTTAGKFVVVILLVVGLAMAFGAWSWWQMQNRHQKTLGPNQAAVDRTAASAEQRLREIGTRFEDRLANHQDADSFLKPAQRLVDQYPEYADARNLFAEVLHANGMDERALEQF